MSLSTRLQAVFLLLTLVGCDRKFDAPDWYAGDAALGDAGSDGGPMMGPQPTGTWVNVTNNLANLPSACGNLSAIVAKPDEDLLLVGVQDTGVFYSRDGGATWEQANLAPGGAKIPGGVVSFLFDPNDPMHWWITVIYSGQGVYETHNNGGLLTPLGDVRHNDLLTVDFADPEQKVMLVGSHERAQTLMRSEDSGKTWSDVGAGLPPVLSCTRPLIVNATTYLVGCSFTGDGIFRSADSGSTWTMVDGTGGVMPPLATPKSGIFWPTAAGSLMHSMDEGLTWEEVTPKHMLKGLSPVLLPDGRIAALGNDGVLVSDDLGKSWKRVSVELPFEPDELTYSAQRKAFYVRNSDCGTFVRPDAVARYDFDWETNDGLF
ncbi:MAG: hypothetical protein QM778_25140 [Myxococcales bacterium]